MNSDDGVCIEFFVSNKRDHPTTLIIEPWAEEFPIAAYGEVCVVSEKLKGRTSASIQVTNDYIILDVGDDVRVRYDGLERFVGEVD